MEELKRGRGRPKKTGARRKQLNLRVTEDFYNELKELSEMDGKSCVDYIVESVERNGALTRIIHERKEEDFIDYEDYDFDEN